VRGRRLVGERAGDKGAEAGAGRHQALVLELAIRLQHRVRVDGHLRDHLLDGGQTITFGQQTEPQRPPYLLDELHVRGDAGPRLQVKFDHSSIYQSTRFLAQ
jgi:hypothetical protein